MKKQNHTGILEINYAKERISKRSLKYRLRRRSDEVFCALDRFASNKPLENIVDLGTADGRMLNEIKKRLKRSKCIGVEYGDELVKYGKMHFQEINVIQGDIQDLPFADQSFDVATLTAVIEHLPKPEKAIQEASRILKPGGILIVTSPDPFWEHMATKVGHLKDGQHHKVMNITELTQLIEQNKFKLLTSKKFMLSPIGMPYELKIERWIRKLKIDFMLANQLLVAERI